MALLFKDVAASGVHSPTGIGNEGRRRKRIMRAFQINEISAVSHPAQVHARVLLHKCAGDPVASNNHKEQRQMN